MFSLKACAGNAVGVAAAVTLISVLPAEARMGGWERPSFVRECSDVPDVSMDTRTCTYYFQYTRTIETFVVPLTSGPIHITAVGAPGAGKRGLWSYGATVTGSFDFLPGTPLYAVVVGGEGWFDGYNGGGAGGGGGASDVRLGAPDLQHRIIVAGGGGGWGERLVDDPHAGQRLVMVKGGDAGQPGGGSGGQPGTAMAGGAGGGTEWGQGQPGRFGRGGAAAGGFGGGGGGLYGGGGGGCAGVVAESICAWSQPGSGGGGSSLVPPGGTITATHDLHPHVTITVTQSATTLWLPPGPGAARRPDATRTGTSRPVLRRRAA